jgi:hypothetical protein
MEESSSYTVNTKAETYLTCDWLNSNLFGFLQVRISNCAFRCPTHFLLVLLAPPQIVMV